MSAGDQIFRQKSSCQHNILHCKNIFCQGCQDCFLLIFAHVKYVCQHQLFVKNFLQGVPWVLKTEYLYMPNSLVDRIFWANIFCSGWRGCCRQNICTCHPGAESALHSSTQSHSTPHLVIIGRGFCKSLTVRKIDRIRFLMSKNQLKVSPYHQLSFCYPGRIGMRTN